MSRYSGEYSRDRDDYGRDNYHGRGGYRGGYGSGNRGNNLGKINEDDVPQSRHSIFVRGLPSSLSNDKIKQFFEDNIGPCSFDFTKVNHERESIFVAVRFESKDHAKEAYDKYRYEDILGCRCEVTWFRDIRRYIAHQRATGGVIRRGFGRGGGFQGNDRREYGKRRYSDDRDRRSRSRSYTDSDGSRSRSRSRRSSRSGSRSEGERSSSNEGDRRRSKDAPRKYQKKEEKASKRRSRRSYSRSDEDRSRSRSPKESPNKKMKTDKREASPASSTSSIEVIPPPATLTATPTPSLPTPAVPVVEPAAFKITIANKPVVPVENTSFKMALDTDEPPRKIVRGPLTPEKKDDDDMEIEEKEEEVPQRKEKSPVGTKEKGGWAPVGGYNSGLPSDVLPEVPQIPPAPAVIQPTIVKTANQAEMVPRSVRPSPPSMSTPTPPPPKMPSAPLPPPPGRPSLGGGGGTLAAKCPEMAKTVKDIKSIQDQVISTVKANTFRLSADLSSGESALEKMQEREKLIGELNPLQKNKFNIKMKQITNSYKGDAQTIASVVNSIVQKDSGLEDQIKPALLSVLEDLEKQIYKKVDDFLLCGL